MKELTGARGWVYAYKKVLEEKLESYREALEDGEGRDLGFFLFLSGKIRGIRESIKELSEVEERFNVDGDKDLE